MLIKELLNFGLSDKEARVYLASLELGTATIQEISKKSNVNRATTYIQVESLLKQGLLSTVDKNKKSVFMAEKPQKLLEILQNERLDIESKEKKISKLMPDFEAIYNIFSDRPRVRFFQGIDELDVFRKEICELEPEIAYHILPVKVSENIEWESFAPIMEKIKNLKMLYVIKEDESLIAETLKPYPNVEARYYPLTGYELDVVIYSNKVMMNKPISMEASMAVLIEDKMFYDSFVIWFNALWEEAGKLKVSQ